MLDLTRRVQGLEKTVNALQAAVRELEDSACKGNASPQPNHNHINHSENWETSLTHLRLNVDPALLPSHPKNGRRKYKGKKWHRRPDARTCSETVTAADVGDATGADNNGDAEVVP